MKKKKGCLIAVIVVILLFGGCSILFSGSDDKDKADTKQEQATTEATTKAKEKATTATTTEEVSLDDKYDSFIELTKLSLDENFKDQYTIKRDKETVTVSVWQEGLTAAAVAAKSEGGDTLDKWNEMKGNIQYMAKSNYELMETCGIEDGHLLLNVLNDQNKDNVLLSYMDGACLYDAVNE